MSIVDRKSGSASGVSTSDRLGGIPEGIGVKAPVRVATTANITLNGLQAIDGVTVAAGDRVLVKDQTAGAENGIRIASSGNWVRATDFSVNGHVVQGTRVYVTSGTLSARSEWAVSSADDIVIDTSSITFTPIGLAYGQLLEFEEISSPSSPVANKIRLFAKDSFGDTHLFTRDSAGTEVDLSLGGDKGFVIPQQYGALADGSNDYQAFADAIAAAVVAGHKTVFVPPGTYDIGTALNITDSSVCLYGLSRRTTIIRRRAGATLTNLLHIGVTSGNTLISYVRVSGIGFDGNGSCSDAVVKMRNGSFCEIMNIRANSGTGDGFKTDTATTAINTKTVRNVFVDIEGDSNTGNGLRFIGEKDAQYDLLFAHNNTASGIVFRAFKYDGGTLTETTTSVAGTLLSRDNGGDGVVFDGTEKYNVAAIDATINQGYGVRFLSTDVSASGNAVNNIAVASISCRANGLGGLRAADNVNMNGAQFGIVKVLGGGNIANEEGIHLAGVANVQFGEVLVASVAGTAIRIKVGDPLGLGAAQSSNVQFSQVRLSFNGHASATNNHGISIEDSSTAVGISQLISNNSQTTGTNYEVSVAAGATGVVIDNAYMVSNSGSNGISASSGTILFSGRLKLESSEIGVGQTIESSIAAGSAISLTTGTPANITSISLTAGEWEVWGSVWTALNASATPTFVIGAINTTSATLPTAPAGGGYLQLVASGVGQNYGAPIGSRRLTLTATTTVYLVMQVNWTTSTCSGYGYIGARRIRSR